MPSSLYIQPPQFIAEDETLHATFIFAQEAHAEVGQRRKYTNEPYIVHPVAVATTVHNIGGSIRQIQAALLHDTIEDTNVTFELLKMDFGYPVAEMVNWLTDVSQPSDGNRAIRKQIDREHSAQAPGEVQTVKVADLMDNTKSILEYDEDFAMVYITEKALLLQDLTEADPSLRAQALACVTRFQLDALQRTSDKTKTQSKKLRAAINAKDRVLDIIEEEDFDDSVAMRIRGILSQIG